MTAPRHNGTGLWAVSAAAALAGFALLQIWAAWLAGGLFEYPLDDVYIHLAMAKGMAGGTYGVNAGEAVSASSSILYPVLLMPFAGTEAQRLLPLVLNTLAVVAAGALWGLGLARAALPGAAGWVLALGGAAALNVPGVGFTGMENALHGVAALATVLGLWTFLREGRISALLVAGTLAAPLLRLEGLALSGLVLVVLALRGRGRAALALGAATALPVLGFMGFLMAQGLAPLPVSVLAKTGLGLAEAAPLSRVIIGFVTNLISPAGKLLLAVTLLCAALPLLAPPMRQGGRGLLLAVLALAGAAQLVAGQVGWMHRYEHYILAAQVMGLVLVAGGLSGVWGRVAVALPVLACLAAAAAFWPSIALKYIHNPRAIALQQTQMARFQRDYARAPVAVNDLGRVAWESPAYVLDVYGLGSAEALAQRLSPAPAPGWMADLAAHRGVAYAMIYDAWFGTEVGPDWVRLAELRMDEDRAAVGGTAVAIYAVDPARAGALRDQLRAFGATLPAGAQLALTEGGANG